MTRTLQWAGLVLAGVLLLLWPAIYNGYPLAYSDTGGYLEGGFSLKPLPDRSMAYGLFMRVTSLGVSLWGVVAAQAVLLVYLITRTAQAFVAGIRPLGVLRIIAGVALLTPASWYASLLLMDVFTPILLLSAALFVFGRHPNWERGLLAALAVASVATHTANPVLSLLPLGVSSAVLWWRGRTIPEFKEWGRRLVIMAVLTVCAMAGMMSVNRVAFGRFALNPSSHMFMMARLSETPLLKAYLERTCDQEHWAVCKARPELPYESAQYFLWNPAATVASIDWQQATPEYDRIIRDILTEPSGLRFFTWDCLTRGARLLVSLRLTAFDPELAASAATLSIQRLFPHEAPAYLAARQFNDALGIRAGLEWIQLVCFLAATGWLVRSLARGLGRAGLQMVVFLCAGVIVNAFVMAGLSAVDGRYQARVAWLIVLLALVVHRVPDGRHGRSTSANTVRGDRGAALEALSRSIVGRRVRRLNSRCDRNRVGSRLSRGRHVDQAVLHKRRRLAKMRGLLPRVRDA